MFNLRQEIVEIKADISECVKVDVDKQGRKIALLGNWKKSIIDHLELTQPLQIANIAFESILCTINKNEKAKSRFTKKFLTEVWNKLNINMALGKARGKYENIE